MVFMGIAAKPSILYSIFIYRLNQIKYENHEIINHNHPFYILVLYANYYSKSTYGVLLRQAGVNINKH